jgi:DNA-binding NarL/FixJ family response regulator
LAESAYNSPAPLVAVATPPSLRVAVVADDDTTGATLRACLARGGLAVAGGVIETRRIDAVAERRPEAIVLAADLVRPGGLTALRRLQGRVPAIPVVVVVPADLPRHAARTALNAGAAAYVPEPDAGRTLALAVRAAVAGLVCVPRDTRGLVAKPTFSQREKDVLGLLVSGLSNAQIAARLYLAESTVKSHLASAFAKLGVRSRRDAVALVLDPAEGLAATALPVATAAVPGHPNIPRARG